MHLITEKWSNKPQIKTTYCSFHIYKKHFRTRANILLYWKDTQQELMGQSATTAPGCNYSNMLVFPFTTNSAIKSNYKGNGHYCISPLFFLALAWCLVGAMISFIRLGAASDRRHPAVMRRDLFENIDSVRRRPGPPAGRWLLETDRGSLARRSIAVVKSIWSSDSAPHSTSLLAPPGTGRRCRTFSCTQSSWAAASL